MIIKNMTHSRRSNTLSNRTRTPSTSYERHKEGQGDSQVILIHFFQFMTDPGTNIGKQRKTKIA